jgi:hypothetical protein
VIGAGNLRETALGLVRSAAAGVRRTSGLAAESAERPSALAQWRRLPPASDRAARKEKAVRGGAGSCTGLVFSAAARR